MMATAGESDTSAVFFYSNDNLDNLENIYLKKCIFAC